MRSASFRGVEAEVDAEGSSLVLEISADEPPGKGRFITRLRLAAHRKGDVKSELIRLKSVGSAPRGCRHCRQLLGADPVVGVVGADPVARSCRLPLSPTSRVPLSQ